MIETSERATSLPGVGVGIRGLLRFSVILTRAPVIAFVALAAALVATSAVLAARLPAAIGGPYVFVPILVGAVQLLASAWSSVALRDKAGGNAVAVLAAALAIMCGLLPDALATRALNLGWILGNAMAAAALLDLATQPAHGATSPNPLRVLRWLAYAAGAAVPVLIALRYGTRPSLPSALPSLWYLALAALTYIVINGVHALRAPALVARTQARLRAGATVVSFAPWAGWLVLAPSAAPSLAPLAAFATLVLTSTLVYSIQYFSMAGTARWLRQSAIHGLVSALILGGYALLVAGAGILMGTVAPTASPLWLGGFALLFAILLQPLRTRVQALADRTFFKGQRAVDETVEQFTRQFSGALSLNEIVRTVREAASSAVGAADIHIFHYDALNDQFVALADASGRPTSDLRFPGQGAVARHMAQQTVPLQGDGGTWPASLQAERNRLAILGTRLLLPLPGRGRVLGWIAIGKPRSSQSYSSNDVLILEQLASQAALAIGRIETVEQLQRRLQEMNALTRVAQGVNITLTYDDVLELIYAQTGQIVPFSHFRITLYRAEEDYFYLAFAAERNERLAASENAPLPAGTGLAREVIRRGRPIITQDYESECRTLSVEPEAEGIAAWMGVPLNAGAESIGALSVGIREPGAVYTPAQLDLLHAVADQTAGAIVKARLLRETQQRAAQLGKLNEVARQFVSIRDLDRLRQAVVDGTVSVLECQGGIFYAIDQPTTALTVQVVSGRVSAHAVGEVLAPDSGPAGAVISGRGPVMENDLAPGSSRHFLDRPGAVFVPHSSLAAPLIVQDSLIGVLELLDRQDGGPFVPEDRALLLAFAGQAAAALENLRLYTLTDQELAARVEELSVMQRIDRELNASLEMDRAMRITLEWALRQSTADAGLIGLLEAGRLRIMTELGYGRSIGDPKDQTIPLALPGFQVAIDTGLPQRVRFDVGSSGFLPAADHQVVVPIRREANVIGLLILESLGATQEDIGFLGRLSDHAAIAISNAQLYDEVQRANVAKSDFVSLVAHELKNPMTSIKGYTELLVAGAVGDVNEMQAGFLNTIRSNTERMSTLVSDLNDNSKIEAGRLRLDFRAVELVELIDETVRSTKRQLEEKKQSVQLDLPDQLPNVWSDRTRLGQVLTNLISNANKYTPESGTLTVGAERSANHWDPEGAAEVVHMWVRDDGIGISPEDQQKIFQKFFRSEDPKAREVPGAGLGLNITRSLVEMQGGRIWFESQYRQGTTFHFTVPVAEA